MSMTSMITSITMSMTSIITTTPTITQACMILRRL
jgi:hypothetical protein